MRYMGSKARHAKHIIPILMDGHDQSKPYIEPFVGGGNMIDKVPAKIRWGSDLAEYAIALLDALSKGWEPPSALSELEYHQIKECPHGYDPELVGFAAYSCSFAGKFWGGYARGKNASGYNRNYAEEQARHLSKQSLGLSGVKFTHSGYENIVIPAGATVYCDPPYAGTTKYKSGGFDHATFWEWAERLSATRRVFVSEYSAPGGWDCVWEREANSSLTKDTGSKRAVEKLFTLAG